MLRTKDLNKCFGALKATSNVNLHVEPGTIHSIIGPNGAGKTTLFNLLVGVFPPTSGQILFSGKNISKRAIHERCQLGIGRSFQVTTIFPELSVAENVRLACQAKENAWHSLFSHACVHKKLNERTMEILEFMGIADLRDEPASTIPYGSQRALDVAIAVGSDPKILLLDEPTSGMSPDDTLRMIDLIKRLSRKYTIVLIEHHMNVVMSISDTISVLQMGQIIAKGTPEEIQQNDVVKRAYLGESEW